MEHLNDLPKRHPNHDIETAAESALFTAIEEFGLFVNQKADRNDYGTDVQIEARQGESMTNIRVHVQLKGTDSEPLANGSVSVVVARTNLNYLLAQADSIYVCWHRPTRRLLARYAGDVYREYEHSHESWTAQDSLTINFRKVFDKGFQNLLHERVINSGISTRNRRLHWSVTPPDKLSAMIRREIPLIEVPPTSNEAIDVLNALYGRGHDDIISHNFENFATTLRSVPGAMDRAYFAETNLALNGLPFDRARIVEGIEALRETLQRGECHPGSIYYSLGNARFALGEYESARLTYLGALGHLVEPEVRHLAAQCLKNLGSVLEAEGAEDDARSTFEQALVLDSALPEANFALARWYQRNGRDPSVAIDYFDRVIQRRTPEGLMYIVQGWRAELFFQAEDIDGAFRDIQCLLNGAGKIDWIWPWCARLIQCFGRSSVKSTKNSLRFWQDYLCDHPADVFAEQEYMLCLYFLHIKGVTSGINFPEFKTLAETIMEKNHPDPSFLWDRVGHWAQHDGNWIEAEENYRRAYEVNPVDYGYCLGTALNFLDRWKDALPILLQHVEGPCSDAMSWFQVAVAREGTSDIEGSIAAYLQSLDLDPDYDLAWFNLGGMYWNSGDIERAESTWSEAVRRYPDHELAKKPPFRIVNE